MEDFDHQFTRKNSVFLIQSDETSCLLVRMIKGYLDGHGIIVLHSHRGISTILSLLQANDISSCEISGQSDIDSLCKNVNSALKVIPNTLVTSSVCLLHIFAHGLMRVEEVNYIIFDNLTDANHQHPYRIFMEVTCSSSLFFVKVSNDSIRHFMILH